MNLIDSFIEIKLNNPDDFLKIKETLTRIGIASFKDKKLYQSCHILHKREHYYLVHFKELFALDGKKSTLDDTDLARRNTIAKLLQEWGLCSIVGYDHVWITDKSYQIVYPKTMSNFLDYNQIKILPFSEKDQWELISKYSIGKKKYSN